ncbi:MAG: helix-turn-helix transcriptional regulator [Solirubrobacterales bacterium]
MADAAHGKDRSKIKDPELAALGARVAALRAAAEMTQEGLAHSAGLHWTYIGQIERGERNLSYKNLLKLARGLGVDPAQLLPVD